MKTILLLHFLVLFGIITISRLGANPARYWKELVHDSYHRERGQAHLSVHGRFAERLGLSGEPTETAFKNIFDGYSPDRSKRLVHRTLNRHRGLDLVLAIDKSLSAYLALCDADQRKRVMVATEVAAAVAIDFAFRTSAFTLRGAGGKFEEPVGEWLYWTVFHPAARLGQPHGHVHVLIPNLIRRMDGTTGTFDLTRAFFNANRSINAVFNAELEVRLRDLGLKLKPGKHGPALDVDAAVSEDFRKLCNFWSPGSRAISEHLGARGVTRTPQAAEIAHKFIRPRKEVTLYEDLFSRWKEEASKLGITIEGLTPHVTEQHTVDVPGRERIREALKSFLQQHTREVPQRGHIGDALKSILSYAMERRTRQPVPPRADQEPLRQKHTKGTQPDNLAPAPALDLDWIFATIAEYLTSERNSFPEKLFLEDAIRLAHDLDAPSPEVLVRAYQFLHDPMQSVALGENKHGVRFFTTPQRWAEEQRLIELARRRAKGDAEALASPADTKTLTDSILEAPHPDDSVKEAFYKLATAEGSTTMLEGRRGPAADAVLRALARAARRKGLQVVAATATSGEAIDLEDRTGIPARTVNQLLLQFGRRQWEPPRDTLRELVDALIGRRLKPEVAIARTLERATKAAAELVLGKRAPVQLTPKTLFIVSEAQRLSVRTLSETLELGLLSGARMVLAGDSSGLPALAHNGGFAGLKEMFPSATLPESPQADTPYLSAVQSAFAAGQPEHGLKRLARDGRLVVADVRDGALKALVHDWVRDGGARDPSGRLIVANSNVDKHRANLMAQRARWRALRISPLHFLRVEGYRLHQSDRVIFTHGLRAKEWIFTRRIRAGETGTVAQVDIVRRRITVKTDRGVTVTFDPKRFPEMLELGYALTTARAAPLRPKSIHALSGSESLHSLRAKIFAASDDVKLYSTRQEVGDVIRYLAHRSQLRQDEPLAYTIHRENSRLREQELREQGFSIPRKLGH